MSKFLIAIILMVGCYSQAASYSMSRMNSTGNVSSSAQVTILTGYSYTVTLPSCATSNDGEYHIFQDSDTNANGYTVEVHGYGTDSVIGAGDVSTFIAPTQSDTLVCDGPNHLWLAVAFF